MSGSEEIPVTKVVFAIEVYLKPCRNNNLHHTLVRMAMNHIFDLFFYQDPGGTSIAHGGSSRW